MGLRAPDAAQHERVPERGAVRRDIVKAKLARVS
jgi:hypothetical protein